jgi:hypothetical protein
LIVIGVIESGEKARYFVGLSQLRHIVRRKIEPVCSPSVYYIVGVLIIGILLAHGTA